MSRIGRGASLAAAATTVTGPAVAGRDEPAKKRRLPSTFALSLGAGFGTNGSKPAQTPHEPTRGRPPGKTLKTGRKPGTKHRLCRLRRELGRIGVAPADPHSARAGIVDAMARAGLEGWTVPALEDDATVKHADGSLEIALITHAVVFNPGGAFRIVDLHPPMSVYFEMADREGRKFVSPAARDGSSALPYRPATAIRRKDCGA